MKSYKRIAAVKTACEILEFVSAQIKPPSVAEISGALNLPQGTALCHLATLEDAGFIEGSNNAYKLGHKLGFFWACIMSDLQRRQKDIAKQIKTLETGVADE